MLEKPKRPLILGSTTIARMSEELMQFGLDRHFNCPNHDFNRDAKFTVIEELKNTDSFDKEKVKYILEKREDFWMIKLKTIHPDGLNDGLYHPNETIDFRFLSLCLSQILSFWYFKYTNNYSTLTFIVNVSDEI